MLCLTGKLSAGIHHRDVRKSPIDEMPRVQATHHALLVINHVVFTGIEISNVGLQLGKRDRQYGIASPVFAEWLRGQLIGMTDVNDDLMRQGRLHNNHLARPALKILKDLGNQLETGARNGFIKRTSVDSAPVRPDAVLWP